MEMCLCASCHIGVLTGVSARCSVCEGYCHLKCVTNSTTKTNDDDVAYVTICNRCSSGRTIIQNNTVESPTSPLAVQRQDFQNSANVVESARLKASSQQKVYSDKKSTASNDSSLTKKKRPLHWGLIWKKKQTDGDGSEFRSNNILFRGTSLGFTSFSPECQLCQKPYNPHLMYIRCENCRNWHHADAVELDESKLHNLVGYKCCRCRRIKIPVCPYADKNTKKPELKNSEVKKLRIKGPKEETTFTDSISEPAMSEQAESLPSTPMSLMEDDDVFIEVDDPLLLSVSKVEEIPEPDDVHSEWNTSFGLGPQKLPVRRHIKNERDDDGLFWNDNSGVQLPSSLHTNEDNVDIPHLDWDFSNGEFENGTSLECNEFNHENTDYEPQTYFSFTELLDDDNSNNQFGGVDVSGEGWENLACEYSQSGFPDQNNMESFDDLMATTSMDGMIDATCHICSKTTPIPELVCHVCGLMIHSHCSPWEELSFGEAWKCGNCRDSS